MRLNKFVIFGFIIMVVASWLFLAKDNDDENKDDTRKDVISEVMVHSFDYLNLRDTLVQNIDTCFFADYRMKQNQFYFYFLNKANQLGNFFDTTGAIDNKLSSAKKLNITKLKRDFNENFLRFYLTKVVNFKPQILVAASPHDTIKIPLNGDLISATIVDKLETLNDYRRGPLIYKIRYDIWVYFPSSP